MTPKYKITDIQFFALVRIQRTEPAAFTLTYPHLPNSIHPATWFSLKRRAFIRQCRNPYSDEVRLTDTGRRALKAHRLGSQHQK